jgi:hypothetical protein
MATLPKPESVSFCSAEVFLSSGDSLEFNGIIIIIIIHLLGLAPAGYLAAPDSGHEAGCGVVHAKYP